MAGSPNSRPYRLPELLAPAGDFDTLQAAVGNGADAVYLGAGSFNARLNAVNFTPADLAAAIEYAHLRSARVYLTLNTLIADDEGEAALALAAAAWSAGIDGVIIQDVGLAGVLHRNLPDLPLLASTQMTIVDEAGLRAAARLGIRRVILPRELSLAEIGRLTGQARILGLETEIFVHGALCICYSGQCLLSSMIGGRSGNRGNCAQPCRLPWQLSGSPAGKAERGASPLLSPRDQALIDWLPQVIDAGVASLKIEGRMRGRAYVAQTVAAYRDALDQIASAGSIAAGGFDRSLRQAFNRGGGFTDRYISGRYQNDFLTGSPTGSHGVLLGTITGIDARHGVLRLMPASGWPAGLLPGRGDVLSVRRAGADQETASAPIGEITSQGRIMAIKGFHPDILAKLTDGDPVYRMTDYQAEQQALRADRRRTAVHFVLTGPAENTTSPDGLISLTAVVPDGPAWAAGLTVQADLPTEPVTPLQPDRLIRQLGKTGGTPFQVADIQLSGEARLTIASLNELRRLVLDELASRLGKAAQRLPAPTGNFSWPAIPNPKPAANADRHSPRQSGDRSICGTGRLSGQLAVCYDRLPEDGHLIACGADRYYLPGLSLNDVNAPAYLRAIKQSEPASQVLIWLPAAMTGKAGLLQREIGQHLADWGMEGICAGHPGLDFLYASRENAAIPDSQAQNSFLLVADSGANIYNRETLRYYASLGAAAACPSLELSGPRLAALLEWAETENIQLELPLYGRLRLMTSAFCPVGQNRPDCRRCHPAVPNAGWTDAGQPDPGRLYGLLDRKHWSFPLLTHPRTCSSEIFSQFVFSAPHELADLLAGGTSGEPVADGHPDQRPPIRRSSAGVRLYFLEETPDERRQLTALARQLLQAGDYPAACAAADRFQAMASQTAVRLNSQTSRGYYSR